jgi:F0F1-type ATP synthase membrane subunit b/b'
MDGSNNAPTGGAREEHALPASVQDTAVKAQELQRQAELAAESLKQATGKLQELREDLLQSAKAQAEATIAAARSTADEIVQSAQKTAAETLRQARASAEEHMRAAERAAIEHVASLRAESDGLVKETNQKIDDVKRTAEQYVADLIAKLEGFLVDREGFARNLERLVKNYADSLHAITRLRSEVQRETLPALNRLVGKLKGEETAETETEPAPTPSPELSASNERSASQLPASDEGGPVPESTPEAGRGPVTRYRGELVVTPVHSFLQATKFMNALSQVKGVAGVKLHTYSGAKATIDVVTEGLRLAGIDCTRIDGFAVEVVEAGEAHLVLRIVSTAPRPVA